ncbi:MAG: C40 family peptidase [Candidatus Doudnabacteria bacterium]|nr:C40 family peptidase [Candidatus Doudnabacteria bacterium]
MIQGYLAVGKRCAVDFEQYKQFTKDEALAILWEQGFRLVQVDVVEEARKCIGTSRYRRGAGFYQAPFVLDCSTLTKWVYAKLGIWLPRHSIDQRQMGKRISNSEFERGDLIFSVGRRSYWHDDAKDGVGHVGIVTGSGTVIHAANTARGVVEDPIERFVAGGFRGACRIKTHKTVTLESPSNRIVECSWEFRQILHPYLFPGRGQPEEVYHPFE